MPIKKAVLAPDHVHTGPDVTIPKPEKQKLQPFLDSGQMVEDTELEGFGFNPIPPQKLDK